MCCIERRHRARCAQWQMEDFRFQSSPAAVVFAEVVPRPPGVAQVELVAA